MKPIASTILAGLIAIAVGAAVGVGAAEVGKTLAPVTLADLQGAAASLPYFGQKTLVVFYIDPDVRTFADPLADAIDAKKFPKEKFGAIGVVNSKDTWIPAGLVREIALAKQKRYPKSLILMDENHKIGAAWALDDCNDRVAVLVIGKDRRVKFLAKISTKEESTAIAEAALSAITDEVAK